MNEEGSNVLIGQLKKWLKRKKIKRFAFGLLF